MTYNSAYTGPQIDKAARLASIIFDDLPAMLADDRDYTAHTAGDVFWTASEGFRYRVAASGASDHQLTTAGGVKLYVQPSDDGVYNFKAFNPAADGVTDDHPVLVKALAVDAAAGDHGPTIYFPKAEYYMGATVEVIRTVRLVGGTPGMAGTFPGPVLRFAPDTLGLCINRSDTLSTGLRTAGTRADGSVIDGLQVSSNGGTDGSAHGIGLRARARIANCRVGGFPGNGLYIRASFKNPDPLVKGNANSFVVETSSFRSNKNCGIYVDGPDVNAGTFVNVDCGGNGRWGVWESSFLGNSYVGCHFDGNGLASKGGNSASQSCFVTYSGSRYQAMPDATEAELVATTPGTNETIWKYMQSGGANPGAGIPTWVAEQPEGTYFPGGGVKTEGDVNYSAFIGCYNESPWGMSIEGATAVLGGHMLSYLKGGRISVRNGNMIGAPGLSAGDSAVSVSLGGDANARNILAFVDRVEDGGSNTWRLQYTDANKNYLMRNGNLNPRTAFEITGMNTTSDFGSGTPQPYKLAASQIGIGDRRHTSGAAAPTTGAWGRGEIVWNQNASAGGFAGWICVAAGTPGTWKQFGAIEA